VEDRGVSRKALTRSARRLKRWAVASKSTTSASGTLPRETLPAEHQAVPNLPTAYPAQRRRDSSAGDSDPQPARHAQGPGGVWVRPRAARRARLTAAESREKPAAIWSRPRMRACRPPWRCHNRRSRAAGNSGTTAPARHPVDRVRRRHPAGGGRLRAAVVAPGYIAATNGRIAPRLPTGTPVPGRCHGCAYDLPEHPGRHRPSQPRRAAPAPATFSPEVARSVLDEPPGDEPISKGRVGGGVSPAAPHRSVRNSLPLHGSCRSDHLVAGFTQSQCAKYRG
jgi:hypothetical protein